MTAKWFYFPTNDFYILSTAPEEPTENLGSVWTAVGGYEALIDSESYKSLGVVDDPELAKRMVEDYLEGGS